MQTTLNNLKSAQTQLIQKGKMISLGELVAGITYEIQNPLNFVKNFSGMCETTGQGTGLGLSLSYDIITIGHSGGLKVETEEGIYSEFTVILPKIQY